MIKGDEECFLDVCEVEVNQIAICVEGIRTFLRLAKEEAAQRKRDADENV